MHDERRFNLTGRQVADLLAAGTDTAEPTPGPTDPSARAQAFLDVLAQRVCVVQALEMDVSVPSAADQADRSVGEMLLSPATRRPMLESLKQYGKLLVRDSLCDADTSVGMALYYAAIAAGLVHLGAKLSRHSGADLAGAFASLARETWLPAAFAELFAQARQAVSNAPPETP